MLIEGTSALERLINQLLPRSKVVHDLTMERQIRSHDATLQRNGNIQLIFLVQILPNIAFSSIQNRSSHLHMVILQTRLPVETPEQIGFGLFLEIVVQSRMIDVVAQRGHEQRQHFQRREQRVQRWILVIRSGAGQEEVERLRDVERVVEIVEGHIAIASTDSEQEAIKLHR